MTKPRFELPNSIESEMIVIGMMLETSTNNDLACQRLIPQDFLDVKHLIIFDHLQKLYAEGKPCEIQLLIQALKDSDKLKEVGNLTYIIECKQAALHAYSMDEFIDVIIEKSMRRELINFYQRAARQVLEAGRPIDEEIDEAFTQINKISKKKTKNVFSSLKELLTGQSKENPKTFLERMDERNSLRIAQGDRHCLGLPTSLPELDKAMNGLLRSNLIVLAARPGVGKTTLALQIAIDVGVNSRMPTAIFSLEMSSEQLEQKIVSHYGQIPLEKITTGNCGDCMQKIKDSIVQLETAPIYMCYAPSPSITDIQRESRKLKDLYDIKLIVIDYLQLISGSSRFKNSDNRVNEVSEITKSLKQLAMELDIPIVCLAQLNRNLEARTDKRPMLSDLRESGSIEQDADQIIFISRPDMNSSNSSPGLAILDLLKNRHGPTREVRTKFIAEYGKFEQISTSTAEVIEDINRIRGESW